jgi:echinoderm microtubule-associated protein-like 6
MAIDPSGKFCATGQIGPKPQILIWDNSTMEQVARIQGTLLKGIKNLCFSKDGKYLAASAFDDDHSIAVYQWNAKLKPGETLKPVASGKGSRANILSLAFNPAGNQLVATAVKEVGFYTFDGGIVKGKKGTGWTNNAQAVLC